MKWGAWVLGYETRTTTVVVVCFRHPWGDMMLRTTTRTKRIMMTAMKMTTTVMTTTATATTTTATVTTTTVTATTTTATATPTTATPATVMKITTTGELRARQR